MKKSKEIDYRLEEVEFKSGFHEVESGYRFTDSKASIEPKNIESSESYAIHIDYYSPDNALDKDLSIIINGNIAPQITIRSTLPDFVKMFVFEFDKPVKIEKLDILSSSKKMSEVPDSKDKRELGIAFKRLRLDSGDIITGNDDLKNFCIAPWIEGVLGLDGEMKVCCRNPKPMGNWQQNGLEAVWNNDEYRFFRQQVSKGVFLNRHCRECYNDGSFSSHTKLFWVYNEFVSKYHSVQKRETDDYDIDALYFIFMHKIKAMTPEYEKMFAKYFRCIKKNAWKERHVSCTPAEWKNILHKLDLVGKSLKSFLESRDICDVMAPVRQVELINRCNARCIHCLGLHNGSVSTGGILDDKYVDEAFHKHTDILRFFMNGTEFLLYPKWKKAAEILKKSGSRVEISSNEILLTEKNVRHIIDNGIADDLSVSLDGAKKETIESIRVNVEFDKLVKNIRFMLKHAKNAKKRPEISFSFVLMQKNYRELPELIKLLNKLADFDRSISEKIKISIRPLEYYGTSENYIEFYETQHHSFISKIDLIYVVIRTVMESLKTGIKINIFGMTVKKFIAYGFPFPGRYEG